MTSMNVNTRIASVIGRRLTKEQVEAFGAEIDALRARITADLGQKDLDYIKSIIRLQRRLEIGGRVGIYAGIVNPLAWIAGVGALGAAKILDNMEIGHNIMHGQFDWTNDPELRGRKFEWDTVCPGDQWRHSHNYMHHTFTNIVGKDRDVGYGILRMADEQPWHPGYLLNPVYAFLLATFFQWGVGVHDLELADLSRGKWKWSEKKGMVKAFLKKARKQVLKDYVVFPALAGPLFLPVLAGNVVANLIRNYWTFLIIFCGHFTEGVEMFTEEECENETKAEWYIRQLLGSSNIEGGKWFHIMSGNLSHQIEHHMFPDVPANRYAEMAVEVQAICEKYGLPYNTGSLGKQFGTVVQRIFRMSLPTVGKPQASALA
ncbi:MAG: linoleoyl-CoA desaturase [Moraxellaceae bacterium]|jgi:linoleoyl-CoA desaturase|nr:linoleoyl-CoA desaturase [Moraxellaceae bacterium]